MDESLQTKTTRGEITMFKIKWDSDINGVILSETVKITSLRFLEGLRENAAKLINRGFREKTCFGIPVMSLFHGK